MENVVYIKGTDGISITIAECSIDLIQDDTQPVITQFLDWFYKGAGKYGVRQQAINEEPSPKTPLRWKYFLGALADQLAYDFELRCPDWVKKPEYFCTDECYYDDVNRSLPDKYKRQLIAITPNKMREHHVYLKFNDLTCDGQYPCLREEHRIVNGKPPLSDKLALAHINE